MTRDIARSDVYLLIAAGRRAHGAVLAPLHDRGLLAGDDAVVLLLGEGPLPAVALAREIGVASEEVAARLDRLVARGFVATEGDEAGLTAAGERLLAALQETWAEQETAVTGSASPRRARSFRKVLRHYLRT